MQLDEIRLNHFKCFKDLKIQCSKFTLLTGANSSGKSSVLDGILGAVQTKDFPLYYSPNGSQVSMGDFEELAYDHSPKNPFGVGFTFLTEDNKKITTDSTYGENRETKLPKLRSLKYSSPGLSLQVSLVGEKYKAEFGHMLENNSFFGMLGSSEKKDAFITMMEASVKFMPDKMKGDKKKEGQKASASAKKFVEDMMKSQKKGRFSFADASELNKEINKRFPLRFEFSKMTSFIDSFAEEFNFVSSFRVPPERTYYQKTKAALKVESYGNNAIDQIVEWENAKSGKITDLNKALETLNIAQSLKSKKYSGGRYDIRVIPWGSKLPSSLCDVGFGVSQVLPILIADLQLKKNSTLLVSQPEIHLHPSAQANLVNFLASQATKLQKRYILETHSEYLINRLRLLVAKGELKEEDVSVYYLERKDGRPVCHTLRFKKNGQIDGAPKEFFSTYMMDVMDIALNA